MKPLLNLLPYIAKTIILLHLNRIFQISQQLPLLTYLMIQYLLIQLNEVSILLLQLLTNLNAILLIQFNSQLL